MHRRRTSKIRTGVWASAVLWAGISRAGTVSLQWRPAVQRVEAGTVLTIGLYAVSDSDANQPFGGMDVLIAWDPQVLTLLGHVDNGPYGWLFSWFPADDRLDGLNDTWSDGTAFYQAIGRFAPIPPPEATPEGLLVVSLEFEATGAGTTAVMIPPALGAFSLSRVTDAVTPGVFLTGDLGGATVVVTACGTPPDADADCDVDLADVDAYETCLTGPANSVFPDCLFRDLDNDKRVDLRDFARVQRSFTGAVNP